MHSHRAPSMKSFLVGLFVVLLAQSPHKSPQAPLDRDRVVADVRAILQALYRDDVEVLLKYSHPKSIEALGGRDRAKVSLEKAMAYFRERGMKLEELEFPAEPEFIPGRDRRLYAVVATRSIVSGMGTRVLSWNFQLGVREGSGKDWVYLEGSPLTPEILASWIPDFPKEHKFPRVSRERQ